MIFKKKSPSLSVHYAPVGGKRLKKVVDIFAKKGVSITFADPNRSGVGGRQGYWLSYWKRRITGTKR